MKNKLKPLSIYSLNDDTLIMAELSAYAEEFDRLYNLLLELERECFIKTATSYGLSSRERPYTSPRADLSFDDRRKMLLYRMSITSSDFNKESMESALLAAGINGYIIETPNEFKIEINALELFDTMVTENEAVLAAEQFLPAHLTYVFDFRKSQWLELEAQDLTFDEIDAKDLTWEQFDGA